MKYRSVLFLFENHFSSQIFKIIFLDDQPFKFKTYGDSSKPLLVIVPGLDGVVSFLGDVIPELTPEYHVLLFYLPLSSPSHPYSFDFITNHLHDAIQETMKEGEGVVLVGESFGGVVAQKYAVDHENMV